MMTVVSTAMILLGLVLLALGFARWLALYE